MVDAAVIVVLGATLAEWQRRREEEEAARRAAMQNSSSDSDEIPDDVLARRRARVIAKNETKREQERRWEAARTAENQKNDEAIEAAWNQSRRAHSLESMSATIHANAIQQAIQSHREGEKTAVVKLESEKDKPTWLNNPILNTVAEFVAGVGYQFLVVNNLNPLMTIAPAPNDAKERWYASWNQYEHKADSTAFTVGRITGGLLGIAQGVWEIASGIATGTGGTVIACSTGILCLGGGAASIAAGTVLVTHGAVVTANSAYQTGLQIQALAMSLKKDAEMESYEDAKRQGKMGEATHMDDGKSSNPDFYEEGKGWVDIKIPAPSWLRSISAQVKSMTKKIKTYSSEVRIGIDLKYLSTEEKIIYKQELENSGVDMSRVFFINE